MKWVGAVFIHPKCPLGFLRQQLWVLRSWWWRVISWGCVCWLPYLIDGGTTLTKVGWFLKSLWSVPTNCTTSGLHMVHSYTMHSFLLTNYFRNLVQRKSWCSLCLVSIFCFCGLLTSNKDAKWSWKDNTHQITLLMTRPGQSQTFLGLFKDLFTSVILNTTKFQDTQRSWMSFEIYCGGKWLTRNTSWSSMVG